MRKRGIFFVSIIGIILLITASGSVSAAGSESIILPVCSKQHYVTITQYDVNVPGAGSSGKAVIPVWISGQSGSFQLEASGGIPPYHWTVKPGSQLPGQDKAKGFTLSESGVLSGMAPELPSSQQRKLSPSFIVMVWDSDTPPACDEESLTITFEQPGVSTPAATTIPTPTITTIQPTTPTRTTTTILPPTNPMATPPVPAQSLPSVTNPSTPVPAQVPAGTTNSGDNDLFSSITKPARYFFVTVSQTIDPFADWLSKSIWTAPTVPEIVLGGGGESGKSMTYEEVIATSPEAPPPAGGAGISCDPCWQVLVQGSGYCTASLVDTYYGNGISVNFIDPDSKWFGFYPPGRISGTCFADPKVKETNPRKTSCALFDSSGNRVASVGGKTSCAIAMSADGTITTYSDGENTEEEKETTPTIETTAQVTAQVQPKESYDLVGGAIKFFMSLLPGVSSGVSNPSTSGYVNCGFCMKSGVFVGCPQGSSCASDGCGCVDQTGTRPSPSQSSYQPQTGTGITGIYKGTGMDRYRVQPGFDTEVVVVLDLKQSGNKIEGTMETTDPKTGQSGKGRISGTVSNNRITLINPEYPPECTGKFSYEAITWTIDVLDTNALSGSLESKICPAPLKECHLDENYQPIEDPNMCGNLVDMGHYGSFTVKRQ